MAVQPDILYLRSREELLPYEDARFNALMAGVADWYYPRNDTTVWGSFLRAFAMELATRELQASYALVSQEFQYLTPPDIRRLLGDVLSIDKNYPQPDQSDRDYRTMVVQLLQAYQEGLTPQAISDVIYAYTGQRIVVEELYKQIGDGVYNISDRNTIQVAVDISGAGSLTNPVSATQIQTFSQSLYKAISLATPAHVGINYLIIFGSTEDVSSVLLGIVDTLTLIFEGVEAHPYEPDLTLSPLLQAASPVTELSAMGKQVGQYFAETISAVQYAALMSNAFRAEYSINPDGSYTLISGTVDDVILTDSSGNPTGEISKAQGVFSPQENLAWVIKSDSLSIFEMD